MVEKLSREVYLLRSRINMGEAERQTATLNTKKEYLIIHRYRKKEKSFEK